MRPLLSLTLLTGLVFAPTLLNAEPPSGMVGLALHGKAGALKGVGAQGGPFPFATIQWNRFALDPEGLTVTAVEHEGVSLSGVATYRMSDIEMTDEAYFAGIDRDPAAELGAAIGYDGAIGQIRAKALADVSGAHEGVEVSLSYAYPIQLGRWGVTPGVTIARMSGDLANWSYGVSDEEARADRRAYDLDETWTTTLNLAVSRPITERWTAFGRGFASALDGETADSPLVGRRVFGGGMLGVGYTF